MGYPYFQGLLCSFPHLEHVRLEDVALLWDPSDDVTATSWPAQPKLRTLELTKVIGTRNICRWLKSTSSVHSLRRIVLSAPVNGVVNYWGASGLEDLMVVCPLHEIRIEFVPFDLPNQWRSIDIQVNEDAAIRKTMTVFHGHNTDGFYWFSWPTYFFKPHMLPLITSVIVRDRFGWMTWRRLKHYLHMDRTYSDPKYSSLKEVRIIYDGPRNLAIASWKLHRVLRRIRSQGILHVQSSDEYTRRRSKPWLKRILERFTHR
ncbi:unnamed protein product [Somion occarium]|uniref:F-box domain-containing protein n=1 Tax=Somion occarium TaxID=3059160 RepID=A0ABP1D3T1_9APHY